MPFDERPGGRQPRPHVDRTTEDQGGVFLEVIDLVHRPNLDGEPGSGQFQADRVRELVRRSVTAGESDENVGHATTAAFPFSMSVCERESPATTRTGVPAWCRTYSETVPWIIR